MGPRRFGSYKGGPSGPNGLAIGPAGELYVADTQGDRVLVFEDPLTDDVADRVFGHTSFDTGGDLLYSPRPAIPPTAGTLSRPVGLAVDAAGNLYVADSYYNRVLVFERP